MAKGAGNAKGGFGGGSKKMGGMGMKPAKPPSMPLSRGAPVARTPIPRPPATKPNSVGALPPPPGPGMPGAPMPSAGGAFANGGPVRRRPWMGGGK